MEEFYHDRQKTVSMGQLICAQRVVKSAHRPDRKPVPFIHIIAADHSVKKRHHVSPMVISR